VHWGGANAGVGSENRASRSLEVMGMLGGEGVSRRGGRKRRRRRDSELGAHTERAIAGTGSLTHEGSQRGE